jgi:hypothetical protein
MYLRKEGNNKNPGRHPLGIVGVTTTSDKRLAIAVSLIHSSDNFNKKTARELVKKKLDMVCIPDCYVIQRGLQQAGHQIQIMQPWDTVPELYTLLPKQFPKRLNYARQQKGFARMISDEIASRTPKDGSTGQLVPGNLL